MNASDKGMQRRGCEGKMDDETCVMIRSAGGWCASVCEGERRGKGASCKLLRNVGGTRALRIEFGGCGAVWKVTKWISGQKRVVRTSLNSFHAPPLALNPGHTWSCSPREAMKDVAVNRASPYSFSNFPRLEKPWERPSNSGCWTGAHSPGWPSRQTLFASIPPTHSKCHSSHRSGEL